MYQITRNHIVEDLQITDKGTGEELVLSVDLNVDAILKRYYEAAGAFTEAQKVARQKPTEKNIEAYGAAILAFFEVIFGADQTSKLVNFYGQAYSEMLADVVPFINDVVVPKVAEAQQRIMQQYQHVMQPKR